MPDSLENLISEQGLDSFADRILSAVEPAIALIKQQPRHDDSVGTSRFGGLPDVPQGLTWPRKEGRPLALLAQINCREAALTDTDHLLPKSGILHFFYDIQNQPGGYDPQHRGGAVVVYSDAQKLATLESPSDLDSSCVLPAVPIEFRRFRSLPTGPAGLEALRIPEHQRMSYFKVVCFNGSAEAQSTHQLLGHELNLQQSDMQLECQLASHGLYCGNPTGYKDPRRKELESGAGEWRLLFQMDSDNDLNVMWGDCGMLYFWIRKADLQHRCFDQTWTILQCH